MIYFAFLLQTFFQSISSETIQARGLKFVVKDKLANDLKNFLKKYKSFVVAFLQLMVKLHLS